MRRSARGQADGRLRPWVARRLLKWFDKNARDLPWRRTKDPYAIWVSEVMLQQTQVATVVPYFKRFLSRYPTVSSLARASLQDVLRSWEALAFWFRTMIQKFPTMPRSLQVFRASEGTRLVLCYRRLSIARCRFSKPTAGASCADCSAFAAIRFAIRYRPTFGGARKHYYRRKTRDDSIRRSWN